MMSVFGWFNWQRLPDIQYFITLVEGCYIRLDTGPNVKLCVIAMTVKLDVISADDDTEREPMDGEKKGT